MQLEKKDLAYLSIIATVVVTLTLNLTFNTTVINNTYNEMKELQNTTSQIQENNTKYLDNITSGIERLDKRPYIVVTTPR